MKQNSFTGKKHGGTPSQKPIYYSKDKFKTQYKTFTTKNATSSGVFFQWHSSKMPIQVPYSEVFKNAAIAYLQPCSEGFIMAF